MSEHDARASSDDRERHEFSRALLDDLAALERMLDGDHIEAGVRRIGVEQEYFLVDSAGLAAPVAEDVLARLPGEMFTSELARYNLEANLPPLLFGGHCLSKLEAELQGALAAARTAAGECGADILLTGILPTLDDSDMALERMSADPRYAALNDAVIRARGGSTKVRIKGVDEFTTVADSIMLESANTSFQIHFQVSGEEFARVYNATQAATGPVLAAAVNSPLLFGRRLWHETRVALFAAAADDRSMLRRARGRSARVRFGDHWVKDSVLELFREDLGRQRLMVGARTDEHAPSVLDRGDLPALRALCMHNGTIWRWNRPCYGLSDGVAHLRIENRVLPAGPSIIDQVANAAFFYGLVSAIVHDHGDIADEMPFEMAKANFIASARLGLHAPLSWIGHETCGASKLLLDTLIPMAHRGLDLSGIDEEDRERYLGVIERRVASDRTGAQWTLSSLARFGDSGTPHTRHRALVAAMLDRQRDDLPVHRWTLASLEELDDWHHSYATVGMFMTRDLFTVRPDDVLDLAAQVMDWRHVRHVPVEDEKGRLLGLVSHRDILRLLVSGSGVKAQALPVRAVMRTNVVSTTPEATALEALESMRVHGVGCLPVVQNDQLVGIVSERDFLQLTEMLLHERTGD